ncbi:MAG: hypothetical protein Q7W55_17045 [Pseudohongiella sp.]|nr:hypothetical protein [Pseudohongiella sp.]MDO9520130.1 hypothetical protein [Pseudohongiella sp.]
MAAERLRRILLKEMGITSWLPRAPLPGAALSHEQCLQNFLDEPDVGQRSDGAVVASLTLGPNAGTQSSLPGEPAVISNKPAHPAADRVLNARQAAAQLAELLVKKPVEPVVPAPVADRSAVVLTNQDSGGGRIDDYKQNEEVDNFGFSWFNVDKRLAVLAMLPAGNSRLTTNCRQMLTRLLAALHTPWQALMLVDQNFHWPLADDLGLPADATAARQAADGFIARRLREQNCAMLLVLSDGLPWFLEQPGAGELVVTGREEAQSTQLRIHQQFGFAMLATHSLHAMEKDAGLKREAWQSMQLLRERLNR